MPGYSIKVDQSDYRTVKTVNTVQAVNDAKEAGHTCLLVEIKTNPKLYSNSHLFHNFSTGEVVQAEARKFYVQYGDIVEYPEDEWELVSSFKYYSRNRKLNEKWAAYVLPKGVQSGETLYIENMIEDILVTEFWSSKFYAENGVATWDGENLKINTSIYEGVHFVG